MMLKEDKKDRKKSTVNVWNLIVPFNQILIILNHITVEFKKMGTLINSMKD